MDNISFKGYHDRFNYVLYACIRNWLLLYFAGTLAISVKTADASLLQQLFALQIFVHTMRVATQKPSIGRCKTMKV